MSRVIDITLTGGMSDYSGYIGTLEFTVGRSTIGFGDSQDELDMAWALVGRVRANYPCDATLLGPHSTGSLLKTKLALQAVRAHHGGGGITVMVCCYPPYVQFLDGCLASVLAQQEDFEDEEVQIIIGYDAPEVDDELQAVLDGLGLSDVEVICQETGSPAPLYNACAKAATTKYLLMLDADDLLGDRYLIDMVGAIESDRRAVMAYPMIKNFGDAWDTKELVYYSWDRLQNDNFAPNACLVLREEWERAGGVDESLGGFWDWDLWMRMLRPETGHIGAPSSATLLRRVHSGSHCERESKPGGWEGKVRSKNTTTALLVSYCGRDYCLPILRRFLKEQTFPRSRLALYIYDNSKRPGIRKFRVGIGWAKVTYYHDSVPMEAYVGETLRQKASLSVRVRAADTQGRQRQLLGRAFADKTTAIYNWMLTHVTEDAAFILEDDVDPPLNAIERLYEGWKDCVGFVSGWYLERSCGSVLVTRGPDRHRPKPMGEEIEDIDSCGLGCILLSLSGLRHYGIKFRSWVKEGSSIIGNDNALCHDVGVTGMKRLIHWGVPCKHWVSATQYLDPEKGRSDPLVSLEDALVTIDEALLH